MSHVDDDDDLEAMVFEQILQEKKRQEAAMVARDAASVPVADRISATTSKVAASPEASKPAAVAPFSPGALSTESSDMYAEKELAKILGIEGSPDTDALIEAALAQKGISSASPPKKTAVPEAATISATTTSAAVRDEVAKPSSGKVDEDEAVDAMFDAITGGAVVPKRGDPKQGSTTTQSESVAAAAVPDHATEPPPGSSIVSTSETKPVVIQPARDETGPSQTDQEPPLTMTKKSQDDESMIVDAMFDQIVGQDSKTAIKRGATSSHLPPAVSEAQGSSPEPRAESPGTPDKQKTVTGSASQAAASPKATSAPDLDDELMSDIFKKYDSPTGQRKKDVAVDENQNPFSMEDEEEVLDAVLNALDDQQSSVGSEMGTADGDVEGVLNHAIRLASTGSNKTPGTSVLHTHEHIVLFDEINKAKLSAGPATVCAVPSSPSTSNAQAPSFGVGTKLGLVLLFSKQNKLNGILGSVGSLSDGRGAVVSMAFSSNGENTVVGYERGALVFWDCMKLEPLKEVAGESPILLTRYLHPDPMKIACVDADNSMRLVAFTKIVGSTWMARTTTIDHSFDCPITDFSVLYRQVDVSTLNEPGSPTQRNFSQGSSAPVGEMKEYFYVAMISNEGCEIAKATFGMSIDANSIHNIRSPTHSGGNELVCWLCREDSLIGAHEQPMNLALCWSSFIDILQVIETPDGLSCPKIATVKLPVYVHSMSKLIDDCIVVCDQEDSMHVVDCKHGVVAESLKLFGIMPIHYSSRAVGGSRYHGQLCEAEGNAYILGDNKLLSCNVILWGARLDTLVTLRMWDEALELAKGFALDTAIAAVGMQLDVDLRREEIHGYITQMINAYISDTLRRTDDQAELKKMVNRLLGFCISVNAPHLFFHNVLSFLTAVGLEDAAMLCIEEELKNKTLPAVPEDVIRTFITFFSDDERVKKADLSVSKNKKGETEDANKEKEEDVDEDSKPKKIYMGKPPSRAEVALMFEEHHPDLLLEIAGEYKMPRLAAVVLSMRRNEHTTPIKHCLGYFNPVAIEYIQATLKGLSLVPATALPHYQRKNFKRNILQYLIGEDGALITLLHEDIESMITILSDVVANEADAEQFSAWGEDFEVTQKAVFLKLLSLLVDTSISAKQPWLQEKKDWPPYSSVLRLHHLYGSCVANHTFFLTSEEAQDLLLRLTHHYVYIFPKQTPVRRRQLQDELCALYLTLNTQSSMKGLVVDFLPLVDTLKGKRLIRALCCVLGILSQYDEAIAHHLSMDNVELDPLLREDTFKFISSAAADASRAGAWKVLDSIRTGVKRNLEALVAVNAAALAQFVFEHLPESDHRSVLDRLEGASETYLLYMREMMASAAGSLDNDDELQTKYLELLCIHRPSEVYPHLVEKDGDIKFDIARIRSAAQKHKIIDAATFLLEKTYEFKKAMELVISAITDRTEELRNTMIKRVRKAVSGLATSGSVVADSSRQDSSFTFDALSGNSQATLPGIPSLTINSNNRNLMEAMEELDEEKAVFDMTKVGIELCKRHASHMDPSEIEFLWFQLLDRFARPKRLLFERQHRSVDLRLTMNPEDLRPENEHLLQDGFDESNELEVADRIEAHDRKVANRDGSGAGPVPTMVPLVKPLSNNGMGFVVEMQNVYGRFVSYVLTQMVQSLDLPVVVGKIVLDNEREKFGPFKPIIVDILRLLSFKLEASRLTKEITDTDAFRLAADLRRALTGGVAPRSDVCGECGRHLSETVGDLETLRFFRCGHGYHEVCAGDQTGEKCKLCIAEENNEGSEDTGTKGGSSRDPHSASVVAVSQDKSKETKRGDSTANEEPPSSNSRDIAKVVRRLKATRYKMSGNLDFGELLKNALKKPSDDDVTRDSEADAGKQLKALGSKNLLLAAAPPETPCDLSMLAPSPNWDAANVAIEALTTDEIIDLFGEDGQYVPTELPGDRKKKKKKSKGAVSGTTTTAGGDGNRGVEDNFDDGFGDDDPEDDADLDW